MNIHDIYRPFFAHFRAKRIRYLYGTLAIRSSTRILDVGGTPYFWRLAQSLGLPLPKITMANLDPNVESGDGICFIIADGKHLPFRDLAFDVAFSNSVVEHLGSRGAQIEFAQEIRRVARTYFLQTPNKRFPVEPHLITPFIHWLPPSVQRKGLRNFTVWGLMERPSAEECERFMDEIKLLDEKETQTLFPDALIVSEKLLGIPKSIIAIRKN